jgi:hypothetical protein
MQTAIDLLGHKLVVGSASTASEALMTRCGHERIEASGA